jgi:hypothetical protein
MELKFLMKGQGMDFIPQGSKGNTSESEGGGHITCWPGKYRTWCEIPDADGEMKSIFINLIE